MHDSSQCSVCRGLPVGGSLTDDEFFAFVARCREELAAKQSRFQERIAGAARWTYEMADRSLTIGDVRFGMTPVATFHAERNEWLWAWANDRFPHAAREASLLIQSLRDVTGFQVFVMPGIDASTRDAEDLAALAVHQLDAVGLFRCPTDDLVLYLAVHDEPI